MDDDNIYLDISPEEFLCNFTTPERAQLLTHSFQTLVKMGYGSIIDEYEFLKSQEGIIPNNSILDGFCDLVTKVQSHALSSHGIFTKRDTPLQIVDNILNGILMLDDYEDPEQLLTSLQLRQEMGDADVFADMLEELIGEDDGDEAALYIASVSPGFLNGLETYLNNRVAATRDQEIDTSPKLDDATLNALKLKVEACGELTGMQMPEILSGAMPIGLPYAAYVGELAYRHRKEANTKVIAADLLLAVDVSADRTGDALAMIAAYATEFSDDVTVLANIAADARKILGSLPIEPK